ncbi:hypothetical protein Cva_01256 [Caedimonas varicaedens]|uniref:Uncharacterized protein n=1 Tax=Caedimonas varicaedens TaxID=1629334 RepID=A0A0K8MEE7_9PROT|nr:hypothetical protein Cva_01256 [Caedimonas varicaedens]
MSCHRHNGKVSRSKAAIRIRIIGKNVSSRNGSGISTIKCESRRRQQKSVFSFSALALTAPTISDHFLNLVKVINRCGGIINPQNINRHMSRIRGQTIGIPVIIIKTKERCLCRCQRTEQVGCCRLKGKCSVLGNNQHTDIALIGKFIFGHFSRGQRTRHRCQINSHTRNC